MKFNVFNGEYPFDILIGQLTAETAEEALKVAVQDYGKQYPHPVVEPVVEHD
jgi:phosphopantothenate synthetase